MKETPNIKDYIIKDNPSPLFLQKIGIISELINDLHSQTELIIESLLKMSFNDAGIKVLQGGDSSKLKEVKEAIEHAPTFLEQLDRKISSLHSLIEKTNIIRQHIQELI